LGFDLELKLDLGLGLRPVSTLIEPQSAGANADTYTR
jgi:hypothetical protein